MFDRNKDKLLTDQRGPLPKRKKNTESFTDDRNLIAGKNEQPSVIDTEQNVQTTQEIINIPPFLNNGTFTESEVKKTKATATLPV